MFSCKPSPVPVQLNAGVDLDGEAVDHVDRILLSTRRLLFLMKWLQALPNTPSGG
jgi:hypothetical protein